MAVADLIRTMLAKLSPQDAQDLGIRFARRKFPDLFPYVHATATSRLGRTTSGLPDAYFVRPDGRSSRIEVTSGQDWTSVQQHLEKEVQKLVDAKVSVSHFVYISTNPNIHPKELDTSTYVKKIAAAGGIDPADIHLVWGTGLVEALEQPAMRRILLDFGCRINPRRFRLVRAEETLDGGRLVSLTHSEPFVPSPDDLQNGLVHKPRVLSQIVSELEQRRISLVKGLGASGKTVLAWLIGLHWREQDRASWYLDLRAAASGDGEFDIACEEDVSSFGDPSSLFIVDNCHVDEERARKLFLLFESGKAEGAGLLLLGRELKARAGTGIWGIDTATPTMLVAGREDLKGVYRRLAARRLQSGGQRTPPPLPSDETLSDWLKVFGSHKGGEEQGADLILFSAAVRGKLDKLINGTWSLSQADAVDEMQKHYLSHLSSDERTNLFALATLQQAEIALKAELLPNPIAGLKVAREALGLVIEASFGQNQAKRLEFVHSSLASLTLLAGDIGAVIQEQYIDRLLNNERGMSLSSLALVAFSKYGNTALAKYVVSIIRNNSAILCASELEHWPKILPHLVGANGEWPAEFVSSLAQKKNVDQIIGQVITLPIGKVPFCLRLISSEEPFKSVLFPLVADEICRKEGGRLALLDALVGRLFGSSAGSAVRLLEFFRDEDPFKSRLFPEIADELCRQKGDRLVYLDAFTSQLLASTLHEAVGLLELLRAEEGFKARLFPAVAAELCREEDGVFVHLRALVGRLLVAKPDATVGLLEFLRADERFQRRFFPAVAAELCREEEGVFVHLEALVGRLLAAPPDATVGLLEFLRADERFQRRLFPAVAAELCRVEEGVFVHLEALVGRLLAAPPDATVGLLEFLRHEENISDTFWPVLSKQLCHEDALAKLAEGLELASCPKMVAALRDGSLFYQHAFKMVRSDRFLATPRRGENEDLEVINEFSRVCKEFDREDLARDLAIYIIARANPGDWTTPTGDNTQTNLGHITRLVAATRGVVANDLVNRFLDQVVTPQWLDELYSAGSAGRLAGSLHHVWLQFEPTTHHRFMRDSLQKRLDLEVRRLPDAVPEARYQRKLDPEGNRNRNRILCLIGVTSLFGLHPSARVRWPNSSQIERAYEETWSPRSWEEDYALHMSERSFWLGLRIMGSSAAFLAKAPQEAGARLIGLWNEVPRELPENARPLPDHVKRLNDAMVVWLERCRKGGWWLAAG
jgi:hypothetical protein